MSNLNYKCKMETLQTQSTMEIHGLRFTDFEKGKNIKIEIP